MTVFAAWKLSNSHYSPLGELGIYWRRGLTSITGTMAKYYPKMKKSRSQPASTLREFTGDPESNEFAKTYLEMPLEEKRKLYSCGDGFITLADVTPWQLYYKILQSRGQQAKGPAEVKFEKTLLDKVSLWQGDITKLEIDAIVNAANNSLLGGGGVDGCIHKNAGSSLRDECETLKGCDTGKAKITGGHKLPAKYILHTVGPVGEKQLLLKTCYLSCLDLVKKHKIKSVAFPCISAGVYGYPSEAASRVALDTVRFWLERGNADKVDRIIFCLFNDKDVKAYEAAMQDYFPCEEREVKDSVDLSKDTKGTNGSKLSSTVKDNDMSQERESDKDQKTET